MQEHVHAETEGAAGAPEIPDRYADLRSWWRTPAAQEFIHRIYADIEQLEQKTGSRVRRRQARHGRSFTDALIRFVGARVKNSPTFLTDVVAIGASGPPLH